MPTIILLDNSLSMYKTLNPNGLTQEDVAHSIIKSFLDRITQKKNFEYVSIVSIL